MDATRRPVIADPDFDPPPAPLRLRDFEPSQRLVVNPFLAVLDLVGLVWLARELTVSTEIGLISLLALPVILLPYLVQFHCLDCGRTGLYIRHRRHACPAIIARRRGEHPLRFPFFTPWAQLVCWGWLLGAVGLLLLVVAFSRSIP